MPLQLPPHFLIKRRSIDCYSTSRSGSRRGRSDARRRHDSREIEVLWRRSIQPMSVRSRNSMRETCVPSTSTTMSADHVVPPAWNTTGNV